jgi:hypothetical protein
VSRWALSTRGAARLAAAALVVAALAACRDEGGEPRVLRSVRLAGVDTAAALRVDGGGRVWIVAAGGAVVVDTGAAPVPARIAGADAPRGPLRDPAGRLYAEDGPAALAALRAAAGVAGGAAPRLTAPVAGDPRGRWIYGTLRNGGVVGLAGETGAARWGWPEAGTDATALAVSPLGDRVYLALAGDDDVGPRVQVRDAESGRVLATVEMPEPVRWLAAAPDGTLLGWGGEDGGGSAFALATGPDGLTERWRVPLRRLGLEAPVRARLAPAGDRVAFLADGPEGRLVIADSAGALVSRTKPPRDAQWDAAGRLHLLYDGELRTVR